MAVHTSVASFNRALTAHAVRVRRSATTAFQDTIRTAGNVAVQLTPTDTGFMRSNWAVVPEGETPPVGRSGSYRELAAAQRTGAGRAVQVGASATDEINVAAGRAKIGERRDVANATEYGQYVEAGSSQQAPAGVLMPAAQAAGLEWSRRRLLTAR